MRSANAVRVRAAQPARPSAPATAIARLADAAGFLVKDAGPALLSRGGRINAKIAAELFISLSTVKTHITRIQDKLGIRNRAELAAWSRENRIMGSSP